ncbi:HAD family hydrolase [Calderihabitans maritimus]|uniref:HAD-superfamily hydrolase n=1 Tax=Calderihabitans maritimus TaxID=1246530 RepID=A0A1Z5HUN0_9FIRM|nr:HAD-IA family hydrolase [Calderihabitans maritimus]GAW93057.1 HAD-superfamily hydrolase [Calderihabitans maritimus]
MRITTVLFDLDGTLTDSLPLIEHTYRQVFREMGIPWDNTQVMKLTGLPLRRIAKMLAGDREEEFYNLYRQYYSREHDRWIKLYPGTEQMLQKLHNLGFRLGIVTSKGRKGTEKTVGFTGLERYMSVIVTADDVSKHKPEPEPVERALKILEALPEHTVYVGDSPYDLVAGQRAGVKTIGVSWGMAPREVLVKHDPWLVVDRQEELVAWLESRAGQHKPINNDKK